MPPLTVHIEVVLRHCACLQIQRVYAASVVTKVEDNLAQQGGAVEVLIGETVSPNHASVDPEGSVAPGILCPCPLPAGWALLYLGPETIRKPLAGWAVLSRAAGEGEGGLAKRCKRPEPLGFEGDHLLR